MALQILGSNSSDARKRKGVPTGWAEEVVISDSTFKSQHRLREAGSSNTKAPARKRIKGDVSIVSGPGAYRGPWSKFSGDDVQYELTEVEDGASLASDEEYEEVEEDEGDTVLPSGTSTAPMPKSSTGYTAADSSAETTEFHGSEQFDYQGRTYMHVPQDLDIDLRGSAEGIKNYLPKTHIHTWRAHTKAVTSLRFFPNSGHLLLSSSADCKVKIFDVYHERELLRTYSGHSKAITATDFDADGKNFVSASFDRMIKIWDTEYGKCTHRFSPGKIPHVVKFNPDIPTELLAGISDNRILQYDTRSANPEQPVQEYNHHLGPVNTITFVNENRQFITTSDDKSLRAWDYQIPVPVKYHADPSMFSMSRASLHPSGKYVVLQSADNSLVVYGADGKFRQNRKKSFRGHNSAGFAIDVVCSNDGQFVMSGDSGGYVCFWDWKRCNLLHKMQAVEKGKGPVTCVAWHPRETSKVVTAGLEGTIKYWD